MSQRQMGLRRLGTESSPDSLLEQKGFEPLVPPTRSFLRSATVILGRRYRPSFEPSQGWRFRAGCELTHDGAVQTSAIVPASL